MSRTTGFIVAAVLIVLGIVAFPLQNLGKPETVCAKPGTPTSGFADADKDCGITIESYNEIRDFESGPKLFRIGGILLILVGVGFAGYGATRKRPGADTPPRPDPAAAG
jgi:hypothetical protein